MRSILFLVLLCTCAVVYVAADLQDIEDTDDFEQLHVAQQAAAEAKKPAHEVVQDSGNAPHPPKSASPKQDTPAATDATVRRPRVVSRRKEAVVDSVAPTEQAPAPSSESQQQLYWLWSTWGMQLSILTLLAAFGVNFWIGRSHNQRIAAAVELVVRPVFDHNFTRTRLPSDPSLVMDRLAANCWVATGTGRKNCQGAQAHLELAARQDLLTGVLWGLVSPTQDNLTISIALHPDDCTSARYVFALVRKANRKALARAYKEVTAVCGQTTVPGLNDSLVCLSEHDELAPHLLPAAAVSLLNKHADLFDFFVVTDQWGGDPAVDVAPKYRHRLVLRIRVPELRRIGELEPLVRAAFVLLDAAATVSLTKHATAKGIKNRAAAAAEAEKAAHKERQEKLAQKQVEKLNKLKAELEMLPPDVRARREEEIKKKEQRKLMKRMSGVRVVKG